MAKNNPKYNIDGENNKVLIIYYDETNGESFSGSFIIKDYFKNLPKKGAIIRKAAKYLKKYYPLKKLSVNESMLISDMVLSSFFDDWSA